MVTLVPALSPELWGGVAISLFYRAKDVSTTRSQAIRTFHHELLRMELDDEDCMWASGAPWGTAVPANYRDLRLAGAKSGGPGLLRG